MSESIDLGLARAAIAAAILLTQRDVNGQGDRYLDWLGRVREFSELCARKKLKSYIAVLGNAMLAKASNPRVDVYSLKAGDKSPGAYDARKSAENVLVPASQVHRFNLGATGPQPLNNQPFFRSYRIDSSMQVRGNARPVLGKLLELLHEIQQHRHEEAVEALAAFITIRRTYVPKYQTIVGTLAVTTSADLVMAIASFVDENSEGGVRAQAVVGGVFDAWYSPARVRVGKRNEPDRLVPGDVSIREQVPTVDGVARANCTADSVKTFSRVFEVRDKNVPMHAALAFITKVADAGIGRAGLVAVASDQEGLDIPELNVRAREAGIDLHVFIGWDELIRTVLFATEGREWETIETAVTNIRARLVQLEAQSDSVDRWNSLTVRAIAPV